jgi:hypothetical protein
MGVVALGADGSTGDVSDRNRPVQRDSRARVGVCLWMCLLCVCVCVCLCVCLLSTMDRQSITHSAPPAVKHKRNRVQTCRPTTIEFHINSGPLGSWDEAATAREHDHHFHRPGASSCVVLCCVLCCVLCAVQSGTGSGQSGRCWSKSGQVKSGHSDQVRSGECSIQ